MKKFASLLIAMIMIFTMAIGTISVSAASPSPAINGQLEAGKSYTMSLTQAKADNAVLYFDGTMNGNFFNGNTDASKAVALTVEAVDGGIRFFFEKDGAKLYIDIHEYTAGKAGVRITDAPAGVFTYNADATTYVVNCAGADRYLGTYNTFTTFSCSDIKYITGDNAANVWISQFPAVFTEVGSTPGAPETTAAPETTVAPETTEAPVVPAAPLLENATLADLSSFVADEEGGKDTSYISRTNADGWKVTGARSDAAEYTGNAPMITLNGKTSAPGTLTSSVIKGGIGKLAFNYGFAFGDNQFSLTINVKKADGTVIKSEKLEKTGLTKETVYDVVLDINANEDVILEIVNNCMTNTAAGSNSNKDRLGIWNLCWTAPEAAPETTAAPVDTTAPESSSDTGDNGVFFAAAALAVVAIAGTAVISKKREN